MKYQDTSTGRLVSELRTKLGRCDCMTQNPYNAIINLGHYNGGYLTLLSMRVKVIIRFFTNNFQKCLKFNENSFAQFVKEKLHVLFKFIPRVFQQNSQI